MSTIALQNETTAPAEDRIRWRPIYAALLAGGIWLALSALAARLPDAAEFGYTNEFAIVAGLIGVALAIGSIGGDRTGPLAARLRSWSPWLILLGSFLFVWELATAKRLWLPMPFFPPPQAIAEVFVDDYARLFDSVWHSAFLLAGGYLIGAAVGFVSGVAIGWSKAVGYWAHPILRFIGPLPATAWLPLAFFIFPTSWSASTFLVALATGFPVTVLTWSGIAGVNKAYYDVARTLGASNRFLILKVAIPAALPHVFVGLFMGLGGSFAVLVVAEMLGVKSGLGWYLQWAQGWAAYANMYAALLVMAIACSGLITLLFRIRDWLLSWQKGLVQW
ncbi:ABC transporter permease [Enterovirga rhinocerotis]|uniref:NitT/TauT family transport system permease protein n=1 Tax=Enterovirga rhinocerotis TaxID=1339210 RepID=A0A4R7BKY6_9HYPH|nr:ABC transporter permease [Enterovirga rhinocerotis]TDR85262.1 NitT/TauT family transport system permease protein [Enterovirga rhinocerotis]